MSRIQIWTQKPAVLIMVYHGPPQSLKANAVTVHHTWVPTMSQAVPQLRRLTASFSRQRIRFNSWPGHVEFVLDKEAQAQAFLWVLGLLPSILLHQYATIIHAFIHSLIHYQCYMISATGSVIKIPHNFKFLSTLHHISRFIPWISLNTL